MNDRKDDFADRDREGSIFREGWHRRLAKAGSPATARGCGELWRALLAAAVAVVVDLIISLDGIVLQEGRGSPYGVGGSLLNQGHIPKKALWQTKVNPGAEQII